MRRTLPLWLVLLTAIGGDSLLHAPRSCPERQATRTAAVTEPSDRPGDAWLEHAERAIAKKEYEASATGGGLQAPNRAHGLRTWFDPEGIRVVDRAEALWFDAIATGHHAQVAEVGAARFRVGRGFDEAKDQSYVLYMLGSDALSRILFPIGHMTKAAVRSIAADLG